MKNVFEVSGHVVDVVNREVYDGTLSLCGGKICGITRGEVPADAPYILPGFIDSHVHIESTLLTPEHFARMAVCRGVTTVVADPHEIANVLGLEGIGFMLENARRVRFHFNFTAPSCVPSTSFETSGAVLDHNDIAKLLENDAFCAEAEFMNAPGILFGDEECLLKLKAARDAGKPVDGHAPGLYGDGLKSYVSAGVVTDHECVSLAEGRERIGYGMKVQIREGSASCDFEALSPLLAESGSMLMFCSDDKYPDELADGYIDRLVSRAVGKGYPIWNVLNAACVTPVKHYGLRNGLLQEGDGADFVTVDNLRDFNVLSTWVDGREVYAQGQIRESEFRIDASSVAENPNVFNAAPLSVSDLRVAAEGDGMKVIVARNLSIRTGCDIVAPKVENGEVVPDTGGDVLKIVVYNRYRESAPRVAFIRGFGLKKGAVASSIAHDSHNIVAVGTSDECIVKAVNRLVAIRGGIVLTDGTDFSELPLPVAGIMSDRPGDEVAAKHLELKKKSLELGCQFSAPFMTLAFMALPVIPELKLTDKGLFDATKFGFTSLFED